MLSNTTVSKLHEMKLSVMAASFQQQLDTSVSAELGFEERFGLLVDAEWASRKNNRLKRLIRKADYAFPCACLEDIEYHADRRLDKALIARLGACGYIADCHNIIILGATGSGKTYLSNAFGIKGSRNFQTVRYIRLPELYGDDTYTQLAKYKADKMIMAVDGISALYGVTTYVYQEAEVSRRMSQRANTVIIAADNTKVGREGFAKIGDVDIAHVVITNKTVDQTELAALEDHDIEVITV